MRRKMRLGRVAAVVLLAGLLLWSVLQAAQMLKGGGSKGNAEELLYQVSELHIELLGSLLQEAPTVKTTAELGPLKQALYTATYTHQHFAMAVGNDELAPLHSLTELMQLMLRLQLGGDRPLKPEEANVLKGAAGIFAKIVENYGELMSSRGTIVTSSSKKISEADEQLEKLLQKQMQK